MSAARGDRKPCTRTGCLGTMQFGREPLSNGPTISQAYGERGWNCSEKAEHFQLGAERDPAPIMIRRSAPASWDDDGGAGQQSPATPARKVTPTRVTSEVAHDKTSELVN